MAASHLGAGHTNRKIKYFAGKSINVRFLLSLAFKAFLENINVACKVREKKKMQVYECMSGLRNVGGDDEKLMLDIFMRI